MRLLALDQSSKITGWAVFENKKLIIYGIINLNYSDVGERLYNLRKEIITLLDRYKIDEVIFEDIQLQTNVGNNVATFKTLAEVYGVLEETFTELKIPHFSVLPTVWKSKVGIKGHQRAEQKKNAQKYAFDTYNLKTLTEDEADAICIGTYHVKKDEESYDWT